MDLKIHRNTHLSDLGFPSANLPNTYVGGGSRRSRTGNRYGKMIGDDDCVLMDAVHTKQSAATLQYGLPRAGPRATLHFRPDEVKAAIVTCGGLCPGLNDVIFGLVNTLHYNYGVKTIYGIRGGYRGLSRGPEVLGMARDEDTKDAPDFFKPVLLDPEFVKGIHHLGGTVLGSSRGGFDLDKILQFLEANGINQLYVIGGDGTHRGAYKIAEAVVERGLNVAVSCVPKTIDNDIPIIDHSFGFQSAVQAAQLAIAAAKTEAACNMPNGVGVVKLMGRSAGYIAAYATLSSGDVDLCLVPEVPLVLEGSDGCLPHLKRVLEKKGHGVVVVAEGAGEELLGQSASVDAGGNRKLPPVGQFMVNEIKKSFAKDGIEATIKYIDPSYIIRSVPANSRDSYECFILAQGAVHGAMAGYTGFSVGMVNSHSAMVPIPVLVEKAPRKMNALGNTWERVLGSTGQPDSHALRAKHAAKL